MAWSWDGADGRQLCWISGLQTLTSKEVSGFPNDLEGKPRRLHDIDTYDFKISLSVIPFENRSNLKWLFVNLIVILSSFSNMQEESRI